MPGQLETSFPLDGVCNLIGTTKAKIIFIAVVSVIFTDVVVHAARASSEIVVNDTSWGCFHNHKMETIFNRQGDKYVSQDKSIILSKNQLEDLISTIKSSKETTSFKPELLGVTPDTVQTHRNEIIQACLRERGYIIRDDMLRKNSSLFDFENILKAAKQRLTWGDRSTTHERFTVTINDTEINKSKIEISSVHRCPWMLPWKVKIGDEAWTTYSTDVPLKLSSIANKRGPCAASLLDGRTYWETGFWTDANFWVMQIGRELERRASKQMAEELPGYEQASKTFSIEDTSIGDFMDHGLSMSIKLKTRGPHPVSTVTWWNHMFRNKPESSWPAMLKIYSDSEGIVQKQKWLMDWLATSKDRNLSFEIENSRCHSETEFDIETYVLPAWRDAKMQGTPEIKVSLRRGKDWCGEVYLSSAEPRALIVKAEPGSGTHWFDKQKVDFHPTTPTYLIVKSNGSIEPRRAKSQKNQLRAVSKKPVRRGH